MKTPTLFLNPPTTSSEVGTIHPEVIELTDPPYDKTMIAVFGSALVDQPNALLFDAEDFRERWRKGQELVKSRADFPSFASRYPLEGVAFDITKFVAARINVAKSSDGKFFEESVVLHESHGESTFAFLESSDRRCAHLRYFHKELTGEHLRPLLFACSRSELWDRVMLSRT